MLSKKFVPLAVLLALAPIGAAQAGPISFDAAFVFLDNDGPNTVGIPFNALGDPNITPFVGNVDPVLGSIVDAKQSSTRLQLNSLFTTLPGSISSSFGNDTPLSTGLTGSWSITATNFLGGNVQTSKATTNSLVGVSVLDRPTSVQINTPTGALSPTVTWTNPAGSFNRNVIEIYNDTTDTRILRRGCNGDAATCNSFQVQEGLLAPNGDYSIRVIAAERADPSDFFTTIRRSNTFVDHNATSAAREAGDVRVFSSAGQTGDVITTGVNDLANRSIHIGQANGPGAVTIDNSSSLATSFINVGRDSGIRGNFLVDGGTVNLTGTDAFNTPGFGGLMTVGRSGVGYADIVNGATVTMESNGLDFAGFQLGRNPGSFGNLNVSGSGTTVTIDGSTSTSSNPGEIGFIRVGRSGEGLMRIEDGAVVSNDPNGNTAIGESRGGIGGGRGALTVDGAGSILNAGVVLNIGDQFGNGGQGRLAVQNGGVVAATTINVQKGGVLTGNGTVVGTVKVFGGLDNSGGIIAPGLSPGLLIIDGDLFFDGGFLLLEADSLTEIDRIQVSGNATFSGGAIEVLLGFTPDPTDILQFFDIAGDITITPEFGGVEVFARDGSGVSAGTPITVQIGDQVFVTNADVASVPEPGMLALFGFGLGGLALARRRRKAA